MGPRGRRPWGRVPLGRFETAGPARTDHPLGAKAPPAVGVQRGASGGVAWDPSPPSKNPLGGVHLNQGAVLEQTV